jgi:hypothetical protein
VENYLVKCFIGRGCLSHWSTKLLGKVYEQSFINFQIFLFYYCICTKPF